MNNSKLVLKTLIQIYDQRKAHLSIIEPRIKENTSTNYEIFGMN